MFFRNKPLMIVLATVIIFGGGMIFLIRGCLSQFDEQYAIPPVLGFEKDGKQVVFAIVGHEKATSYSRRGNFVQKSVSTSYYVQINDAVTGNKIKDRKAKSRSQIKTWPVEILGKADNQAWVFMGGLMSFDPFTLEETADAEMIEKKNPSLAGLLPAERHYYKFNHSSGHILITAKDGSRWDLDTKSLMAVSVSDEETDPVKARIKELDKLEDKCNADIDTLNNTKNRGAAEAYRNKQISYQEYNRISSEYYAEREILQRKRDSIGELIRHVEKDQRSYEDRQRAIENLQGNSISYNSIVLNNDTVNGNWYGLYSNAEMEKLYNRFQYSNAYEETARRKLRKAGIRFEEKYDTWMIDNVNALTQGSSEFLQGGFLMNRLTATPLHLSNPDAFIVLSRSQIGREGKIIITKLGMDGKKYWEYNTGLTDWTGWMLSGNFLIITGTDEKELSSGEINLLITLNMQNGEAKMYDYFKDKTRD
ncbi:MAG: hypothetical protein IPP73_03865 [Chitinophagaceae bacterium]|nr:hypothetical protein [Chitinophagaceae bacterium]